MSTSRLHHEDEKMKSVIEGLSATREFKLSSKEGSVIQKFIQHNTSIANISISMNLRNAFSKPAFEIFMLFEYFSFLFNITKSLDESIIPILGVYLAAAYS